MKYLTLSEILTSLLHFYLLGILTQTGWFIVKFVCDFILAICRSFLKCFCSAIHYMPLSRIPKQKQKNPANSVLEFVYTSLVCVSFLLLSYVTLDGMIRLFAASCLLCGIGTVYFVARITHPLFSVTFIAFKDKCEKRMERMFVLICLPLKLLLAFVKASFSKLRHRKLSKKRI